MVREVGLIEILEEAQAKLDIRFMGCNEPGVIEEEPSVDDLINVLLEILRSYK